MARELGVLLGAAQAGRVRNLRAERVARLVGETGDRLGSAAVLYAWEGDRELFLGGDGVPSADVPGVVRRMPIRARSRAAGRVRPTTPPLDAE